MIRQLPPEYRPAHNLEDLQSFLALQEHAFPEDPRYTAEKWDRRADLWEKERNPQQKDQRVEDTLTFLRQRGILDLDCRIADIGCGPGRFAAAFAPHVHSVTGFDISAQMIAHGNTRLQSQGIQNAQLHCCDFTKIDIASKGYQQAFDLAFASLSPAVHSVDGLIKFMELSRCWCLNISHIRRQNHLRDRILLEVFGRPPAQRREGRVFYAMCNILFLLGYRPETSYMTRRKETRVRPDMEYAELVMELAMSAGEQSPENAKRILRWLDAHKEEDGCLTELSEAVYGRILWDVRVRDSRPDYRSVL